MEENHCSFCRRSIHEVVALISGPSVFICDQCVSLCNDILASVPSKRYWFATSPHGYGEGPRTWEGWLALTVYVAVVLGSVVLMSDPEAGTALAVLATAVMLWVWHRNREPTPLAPSANVPETPASSKFDVEGALKLRGEEAGTDGRRS